MSMFTLQAANGAVELDVAQREEGHRFHRLDLIVPIPFSAGTLKVEIQRAPDVWATVGELSAMALSAPRSIAFVASFDRIRFTLSGVSGGGEFYVFVESGDSWMDAGFPEGAFTGYRALVTQPYTEANVKNGAQFYARASWSQTQGNQIAANSTVKLWFKTGAKKIIVKMRELHYAGEEIAVRLYASPTGVSGGTDIPVRNYNRINPVATTCQGKQDVTTTSDGVLFDGPEMFYGETGTSNRSGTTIPQGRERILPANAEFIVAFSTPSGTGSTRLQYFLDWYEGDPDLPRPA